MSNATNYIEQGSTRTVIGGEIDVTGKLKIGGVQATATAAQLNALSGVTAGTVTASKAVVVDANKDAASLRRVTVSNWVREPIETVVSTVLTTGAVKKPAWSAVAAYGFTDMSASGSSGAAASMAFSLAHPGVSGVRKTLYAAVSSTAKPCTVETAAETQWFGSATGSTGKTCHRIVLTQPNDCVELVSGSSLSWRITSNVGSCAFTTNFTT